MREDQIIALQDIQADVCDVFIEECQTSKWPEIDTKEGRGNRYWMKQNASGSLKIVAQIEQILAHRAARMKGKYQADAADEESADSVIRRMQKKADALLEKAGGRKS